MHWHPYFEIATAQSGVLEYQVGQTYTILEPGEASSSTKIYSMDSTGFRRGAGSLAIIVFFWHSDCPGEQHYLSEIYQPIFACNSLPFVCVPTR